MKGQKSKVKGFVIVWAIAITLLVLPCRSSNAADLVIGGYDVAKVAVSTVNVLKEKDVISESVEKEFAGLVSNWPSDPLALGPSFTDFYSRLGDILVGKNIASQEDVGAAAAAAAKSGGVKIGGVNPVVLAASYLDILVRKGIIELPAAQSILDGSKISN